MSAQGTQDVTGDAVVTATAAIPAGAEITISYIDTAQPLQERQVTLLEVHMMGLATSCSLCSHN